MRVLSVASNYNAVADVNTVGINIVSNLKLDRRKDLKK